MNAYSVISPKNNKKYYLHCKEVLLKSNRKQIIYYFCSDIKGHAIGALPDGFEVTFNKATGLPVLRRKK